MKPGLGGLSRNEFVGFGETDVPGQQIVDAVYRVIGNH